MPQLPSADLAYVQAHTATLWPQLQGGRFFISGGTGFFGRWLLESLTHANDALGLKIQATVLTRDPTAFQRQAPHLAAHDCIELMAGDVRDFSYPSGHYSHIIHAATSTDAALVRAEPLLTFDTIVGGTRRMLDFAVQAGASRFLLVSSGAVYGRQPSAITHVSETYTGGPDPFDPASVYAEGKRAAELLTVIYGRNHDIAMTVARCFAFVGPLLPLDSHFAIGNFIRDALKGGPIRVQGDGTPYRSYMHATDLAVYLWTILVQGEAGRIYNVGSAEALSIAEVARLVADVAGGDLKIEVAAPAPAGQQPSRYVPSIERALHELSVPVPMTAREGIGRTLPWLRNQ